MLGAGVLVGARALDRGGELTVGHLFACFNDKAMPLVIVALLYFGGWFVIWLIAAALLVGILGFGTVASIMSADPMETGMAMLATLGGARSSCCCSPAARRPADHGLLVRAGAGAVSRRRAVRGDEDELHRVHAQHAAVPRLWVAGHRARDRRHDPARAGLVVLLPVYGATMYTSYKDIFGEPARVATAVT